MLETTMISPKQNYDNVYCGNEIAKNKNWGRIACNEVELGGGMLQYIKATVSLGHPLNLIQK